MDEVVSKGAGIAHKLGAQLHGLRNVWKTLAEQHGEAGSLLKRVKSDPSKRAELWPTVRAALRAHEQAELEEIYPVLEQHEGLQAYVARHQAEATELATTIDQMDRLGPSSPKFAPLLDRLITLVDAHVLEEEQQIFPAAQEVLGDARSKALDKPFKAKAKAIEESDLGHGPH
jgi:hemerythrin superfamily protein